MGLLVVLLLGVVLTALVPGAYAQTLTVRYSTTPVADGDLDGDPLTGAWSDAASVVIPLENKASSPYGSATLYAKHDGTYVYLRIDGMIDVAWSSATGNHFWLGMVYGPSSVTGHHSSGQDGVFFGLWDGTDYTPQPTYPPAAVDAHGAGTPPAKDGSQDLFGVMGYSGSSALYSFTAEWKRRLSTGDSEDVPLAADGTSTYNFYVTTDSDGKGSSGGGIGHKGMTNDNTMILEAPPAPVTHDVAVTAASASPRTVVQGETVTVSATVQNQGSVAETFTVNAKADSTQIGTQTVSNLAAGSSKDVSFSWSTSGFAPATYTITVDIPPIPGETETGDNTMSGGSVTVNAPVHDIAITAASANPTTAPVGTAITISATVANQGNVAETFDVVASADSTEVGRRTVSGLAPQASTTVTISWDTTSFAAGTYSVHVDVPALAGESDTTDNSLSAGTVTLTAPPPATPVLKLGRIWPEWRRAPAGTMDIFYAKVVNTGTVAAYAQVVYEIYNKTSGLSVGKVWSEIVLVPAGTTVDGVTFAVQWGDTAPPGIYTVVATLNYGIDSAYLDLIDGVKQLSRFVIL